MSPPGTDETSPSSSSIDTPVSEALLRQPYRATLSAFTKPNQAPNALPICHPTTLTQRIFNWIDIPSSERETWLLWLNGSAHSGKTTIAHSIAETCRKKNTGIVVFTYFFSNSDPHRRSLDSSLISTLVYQLCLSFPGLHDIVVQAKKDSPNVFTQPLQAQLKILIVNPIRELFRSRGPLSASSIPRLLMILDGLDECGNTNAQTTLIRSISNILLSINLPLLVLITSRRENHLKTTFRDKIISPILFSVSLDRHRLPGRDIRHFLEESFAWLKNNHPPKHRLDPDWPTTEVIDELVTNSSRHFLYPSLVINHLLHSSSDHYPPDQQLDAILRLPSPADNLLPTAKLDSLLQHIFSRVHDISLVLNILAFVIIGNVHKPEIISEFFGISILNLESAMSSLSSVINSKGTLRFLHQSVEDFLLDPARSKIYCIDFQEYGNKLVHVWTKSALSNSTLSDWTIISILRLLRYTKPTPQLKQDLTSFQPAKIWHLVHASFFPSFLSAIKALNFDDGGATYKHQLHLIVPLIKLKAPQYLTELARNHNLDEWQSRPSSSRTKCIKNVLSDRISLNIPHITIRR